MTLIFWYGAQPQINLCFIRLHFLFSCSWFWFCNSLLISNRSKACHCAFSEIQETLGSGSCGKVSKVSHKFTGEVSTSVNGFNRKIVLIWIVFLRISLKCAYWPLISTRMEGLCLEKHRAELDQGAAIAWVCWKRGRATRATRATRAAGRRDGYSMKAS